MKKCYHEHTKKGKGIDLFFTLSHRPAQPRKGIWFHLLHFLRFHGLDLYSGCLFYARHRSMMTNITPGLCNKMLWMIFGGRRSLSLTVNCTYTDSTSDHSFFWQWNVGENNGTKENVMWAEHSRFWRKVHFLVQTHPNSLSKIAPFSSSLIRSWSFSKLRRIMHYWPSIFF